jgi:hypothetical protein
MGRPRLRPIQHTVTAIIATGTLIVATAGPAAAMRPWQKSWGDYDSHHQWHDTGWWLKNHHHWVIAHHPEWTDNYSDTFGQIGDSDRFHVWHYGDGSFDRNSTVDELETSTPKST